MLKYEILDSKYENVKEIISSHFHISNRLLTKLKKEKRIFLNGKSVYVTTPVSVNDILEIDIDFDEDSENIVPVQMNLNIVYEDEYLLIINKEPNIPVHPSILHFEDSLSNGVAFYFKSKNLHRKIRPVNRLDKNTSGLVIFAKNEYIQECLIKQMQKNIFEKKYLAILEGFLANTEGTINAPIGRKDGSIIERVISDDGEIAITHFELIKTFEINNQKLSLVEFKLETGRTHQIRLHSKYIGHSILGDTLYGNPSNLIDRQALHAYKISFIHPVTMKTIKLEINLPNDMKKIIKET